MIGIQEFCPVHDEGEVIVAAWDEDGHTHVELACGHEMEV